MAEGGLAPGGAAGAAVACSTRLVDGEVPIYYPSLLFGRWHCSELKPSPG